MADTHLCPTHEHLCPAHERLCPTHEQRNSVENQKQTTSVENSGDNRLPLSETCIL